VKKITFEGHYTESRNSVVSVNMMNKNIA